MTELKPCPFCGGEAELFEIYHYNDSLTLFQAGCEACGIHFRGCRDTKAEARQVAIEKWNRRAK